MARFLERNKPVDNRGRLLLLGAGALLLIALPVILSACGGDGSSQPGNTPTPGHNPQIVPCQDLPSGCPQIV